MAAAIRERTCRACRQKKGKGALLRLVIQKESVLEADPEQVLPGRGWYLCPHHNCLSIIYNPKLCRRAFGPFIQVGPMLSEYIKNPPVGGTHGQNASV
jgi:predicted RNA-binding protein YlxR (DUF448 family)